MNKFERRLKATAKYKKRLSRYPGWIALNNRMLRNHATLCSCALCSPGKVLRNGVKKKERLEILFQIDNSLATKNPANGAYNH
jgi:hypothetical protein